MTHDDDMWQDYDYHQNTGELPEYFDEDDVEYCDDEDYGYSGGPDYIPIHSRCPPMRQLVSQIADRRNLHVPLLQHKLLP